MSDFAGPVAAPAGSTGGCEAHAELAQKLANRLAVALGWLDLALLGRVPANPDESGVRAARGVVQQAAEMARELVVRLAPDGDAPVAAPDPEPAVRILLVEDDPVIRMLAERVLSDLGHQVVSAACGPEALALAAEPGTQVDLLLTDVSMPGMNGRELADRLRAERPTLPVLFVSAHIGDGVLRSRLQAGQEVLLPKPFTPKQMAAAVDTALAGPAEAQRDSLAAG